MDRPLPRSAPSLPRSLIVGNVRGRGGGEEQGGRGAAQGRQRNGAWRRRKGWSECARVRHPTGTAVNAQPGTRTGNASAVARPPVGDSARVCVTHRRWGAAGRGGVGRGGARRRRPPAAATDAGKQRVTGTAQPAGRSGNGSGMKQAAARGRGRAAAPSARHPKPPLPPRRFYPVPSARRRTRVHHHLTPRSRPAPPLLSRPHTPTPIVDAKPTVTGQEGAGDCHATTSGKLSRRQEGRGAENGGTEKKKRHTPPRCPSTRGERMEGERRRVRRRGRGGKGGRGEVAGRNGS